MAIGTISNSEAGSSVRTKLNLVIAKINKYFDTATDNRLVRTDGTTGGTQESVVTLDDAGAISGLTQLNVDNIRIDGNTISSTNTNGDINLTPNGTGEVVGKGIKAASSAGVHLKNQSGSDVILIGAGGGTGTSIVGTANIGSASADYVQHAGGTGSATQTATGSSSDIDIVITPKGDGVVEVGGAGIRAHRPIVNISTNIVVDATHKNTFIVVDATAGATKITVDNSSYTAVGIGAEIDVFQSLGAAGTVLFEALGSQAIISKNSDLTLVDVGSGASLKCIAANTWALVGDLTT